MAESTRSGSAEHVRDPWYFRRWAFETHTGNPTRKAVLAVLSSMADTNTGRCEAKLETLATWTELGERTVRNALRGLEEARLIASRPQYRYDGGRRNSEFLLLAPGVTEWPDGTPLPIGRPATDAGGTPLSSDAGAPLSSDAGQERPPRNDHAAGSKESARASSPDDVVPDDFPAELRPHAREVMRVLRVVAERRGARRVTARGVALSVAPRRHKPLVRAAHDCAAWIEDHPEVACRDVLSRYRKWLDREADLQGLERLDADGVPTSAPEPRPAGVTPIRGARYDEATRAKDAAAIARLNERMGIGR